MGPRQLQSHDCRFQVQWNLRSIVEALQGYLSPDFDLHEEATYVCQENTSELVLPIFQVRGQVRASTDYPPYSWRLIASSAMLNNDRRRKNDRRLQIPDEYIKIFIFPSCSVSFSIPTNLTISIGKHIYSCNHEDHHSSGQCSLFSPCERFTSSFASTSCPRSTHHGNGKDRACSFDCGCPRLTRRLLSRLVPPLDYPIRHL